VEESLLEYVSYPSYSFQNAGVPLESEKLDFHRWIAGLNCMTYKATNAWSFWKSSHDTEGWENTLLPDTIARATAGICTAPYSINIRKPLLHFPKSKEIVKASCCIKPRYSSSRVHSVGLVGWLVVAFCFLFLTSYKYGLHLAEQQLGTKKRTAKWRFRSWESSRFQVNCTSLLFTGETRLLVFAGLASMRSKMLRCLFIA